jgi:tRNA(Ile)-lysidine synthase
LVRRYALRLALERATGGELILSGRTLAAVDHLVVEGSSGQRVHLPGGVVAWREFGKLLLGRSGRLETEGVSDNLELEQGINRLRVGGQWWELDLCTERVDSKEQDKYLPESGESGAMSFCQAFDLDKLNLPLSAGEWYPGDRIELFGGGGSKKLKKLFAERRVPVAGRGSIPVVRDNDGRIVWVCGAARSSVAPLDNHTTRILVAEARRESGRSENDSSGY